MTEDEAKMQDCIGPDTCGIWTYKRIDIYEAPTWKDVKERRLCKGSACKMAWRWLDAGMEWEGYTSQPQPAGEGWTVQIKRGDRYGRWVRPKPPTEGYCGLAGKP
jgi:hypothetical protein